MPKLPILKLPLTPVRKLLRLDLLNPAAVLGKRRSSSRYQSQMALPSRQSVRSPFDVVSSSNSYCIALLNEVEDAVIVTALDAIPFCCHADLLTMTRPQLVGVALKLNARLPVALQIDLDPARPDAYIRNAVELLVGLKRVAPATPNPPRARALHGAPESPQASPLAARSRSQSSYLSVGSPLVAVAEEDEDAVPHVRLSKKRKLDAEPEIDPALPLTPGPRATLVRAQTEHIVLDEPHSPTPRRLLRAQTTSARATEDVDSGVDTAFVTTNRPRRRYRPKGFVRTSTPKKFKPAADVSGAEQGRSFTAADQSELTFGLEGLTMLPASESEHSDMEITVNL